MKERPIICSGEMVRAILDDRKWQTRRVVKITHKTPGLAACLEPPEWAEPRPKVAAELCPYGYPGSRLWVREAHYLKQDGSGVAYAADNAPPLPPGARADGFSKLRPSIHMPRWASRITLEITDIRVERVQDISEADSLKEGVTHYPCGHPDCVGPDGSVGMHYGPRAAFRRLWNSINAKRPGCSWEDNPYCWVIEFRRVE